MFQHHHTALPMLQPAGLRLRTVMIIEDDAEIRGIVKTLLSSEGLVLVGKNCHS